MAKDNENDDKSEGNEPELVEDSVTLPDDKKIVLARHILPTSLPVIPLTTRPLFPKMLVPLLIEEEAIKKMVTAVAESKTRFVGVVLTKEHKQDTVETPESKAANLYRMGVVAEIMQIGQLTSDGPVQVLLGVMERFSITAIMAEDPHVVAGVSYVIETDMEDNQDLKAYSLALVQSIKELIKLNPLHKEELSLFMSRTKLNEPGRLADFAASLTTSSGAELQDILETISIRSRIEKVLVLLKKELDITKLQAEINKQIEDKISKRQREFFLQEQLKTIKKELGISKEGPQAEYDRFAERIKGLQLTDEAKERIDEEMSKIKLLETSSPEFNVSRNYLDWLTSLPWGIMTKDAYNLAHAQKVLNKDHYGLEDVKERILEFLSVGIMKGNIAGSIICFVGPPGVGKTSVGRSIAASVGRQFYRFSLGGIRDEAEIKGHRRTYIGALPGKFIQAVKVCKSANPVIMLDEVDKIGASYQGDPASALLEVLDSEQNKDFLDHYIDVRFDLSNVLFICTANLLDTIPRPLLDRMEVIKLPGYVHQEKVRIAKGFLIPKQLKAAGVTPQNVRITDRALREVIDGYAREPGVRDLENNIRRITRKAVRRIVEGKTKTVTVDARDIPGLLGRRKFDDNSPFKSPRVGVVMGLAWTSMGGDVMYVEATRVAGDKPGFKQTGQLGNVMIESSEIAYTFVRSMLNDCEEARSFFQKNLIHLHVPAGATPKDGPSAGVTMASALYSLVMGKAVKARIAMTGELTLTGFVMPIGGLKEKTIAAKRANVRTLIFPEDNRKDFEELPAYIRKGLKVHFVTKFQDIADICFGKAKAGR